MCIRDRFTVDEYTFGELSQLARLGAGGGAVAGKVQLDPLMVDLSGLPEGLVGLLRDAVTGKNINSIELAGVKAAGEGPAVKVYDLTLSNVRVAGYAEDGGHDTAVAFNYRSGTETIREQSRTARPMRVRPSVSAPHSLLSVTTPSPRSRTPRRAFR